MSPHDTLDTPSPELLQTARASARMCDRIERAQRTQPRPAEPVDDHGLGEAPEAALDEYRAAATSEAAA